MKEEEWMNKIRDFILKQKRASWKQIRAALDIPDKELSYCLKKSLNRRELQAEKDTKDRRITWYSLREKARNKINTEVRRYRVEEFLGNMKESNSHESVKEEGDLKITFSVFAEAEGKTAEWPENDLEKVFVAFEPLGDTLLKKTGAEKLAIFVGFEKKEGVKP
jgi:hypothetical protein